MLRVVSPQGRTFAVPKVELKSEVTWGGKEVGGQGWEGEGVMGRAGGWEGRRKGKWVIGGA